MSFAVRYGLALYLLVVVLLGACGNDSTTATEDESTPPTNPTIESISPQSGTAAGGVSFSITGADLTETTSVRFGDVDAESINVVNSTTVTGVTPAQVTGDLSITLTTSSGSATLTDGFTYLATSVGQSSGGGVIGCLSTDNLIATTEDDSDGVVYGGGSALAGSSSDTDGAANTLAVVTQNGTDFNASRICTDLEFDSQGNAPCEQGNACYDDWFLPARDQLDCLHENRDAVGNFALAQYWSSTEASATNAWNQLFSSTGSQFSSTKVGGFRVRCVRAL